MYYFYFLNYFLACPLQFVLHLVYSPKPVSICGSWNYSIYYFLLTIYHASRHRRKPL